MEYVELLSLLKKNYKQILLGSISGFIISILYFFISEDSYITEGTLYIYPTNSSIQKQEVSSDMNYARNIIGISETPEFRNFVLGKMETEVNYIPLIGLSVGTKIKEITPNLVSLSVKDYSKEKSENKFNTYKNSIIDFSQRLKKGNSIFEIELLDTNLNTYKSHKNVYLYSLIGFFLGFMVCLIYYFLRKGSK
jgi:capsular polysaccharide biosynthesis protein